MTSIALAQPTLRASSRLASFAPLLPRVDLLDLEVENCTMNEAVGWIADRAESRAPSLVAFVNPHCLNVSMEDPAYARILSAMDQVFPDGSGLQLASRILGTRLRENVNGTDLFPHLCTVAATRGLSIYLLGAREGVADQVARNMREQIPGLRIAGVRHGYFEDQAAEDAAIDAINASGADILLVAMGVPLQEFWIWRHRHRLAPAVKIGVGGLFDFYSGRIPRASPWMRKAGIEWVWRLIQEPRRMWRRYLIGNWSFLVRILRQKIDPAPPPIGGTRSATTRRLKSRLTRGLWQGQIGLREACKRALDIFVAGFALVLLAPLLATLALAIKLESRGPALFSQTRIGRDGVPFTMLKLRSMYLDAEARKAELSQASERAGAFKLKRDPRITRIGRFIRKASIDELPQLFNVLGGSMSLVGPRPPLPDEVERYSFHERGRLAVKPGITCVWQVSGRADLTFDRQVELDLDYLQRPSLLTDLSLLFRTVPAVLSARGAY